MQLGSGCDLLPECRASYQGSPNTPDGQKERRAAVEHVRRRFGVSERRACRVIAQPRSSQRYKGRKADRDRTLLERMIELSREKSTTAILPNGKQ